VIEYQPSKCEALSSKSSTTKKQSKLGSWVVKHSSQKTEAQVLESGVQDQPGLNREILPQKINK
jgi:hypothetical protein